MQVLTKSSVLKIDHLILDEWEHEDMGHFGCIMREDAHHSTNMFAVIQQMLSAKCTERK